MAFTEVTSIDDFKEHVAHSDKPVIVDFWAPWCGPCKMLSPAFEALSDEMADVNFVKVNIDEAEEISSEYSIMAVPTLLLVKDGKVVEQKSGALSKEQLKSFIESSL